MTIRASYPVEKRTPVTGIPTQEMYGLIGIAAANRETSRRLVGVSAQGMNACPCAQGLISAQASEALRADGFSAQEVARILDLVPVATHNQRARGTLYLGAPEDIEVDADELIAIVEDGMSSEIYELLKRPDEQYVGRPGAPAAPLRRGLRARDGPRHSLDRFPGLPDDAFVHAHQVNFETIHTHDVEAERSGTIAEIRRESTAGSTSPTTRRCASGWTGAWPRPVNEVAVTAVGADRPGIVAALTGALLEIGGNLEDMRAALLRGSFATVLAVAVPDEVGPEPRSRPPCARWPTELGLGLWVGHAAPQRPGAPLRRCVLSVYGADHPGIAHASHGRSPTRSANIVNLSARLVGDPPIYVLGIEVELPPGARRGGAPGRPGPGGRGARGGDDARGRGGRGPLNRQVLVYPDRRLKLPAAPVGRPGAAARRLAATSSRPRPPTRARSASPRPRSGELWRLAYVNCTGHRKAPTPRG